MYSIAHLLIVALVLGAIYYIFTQVVTLPPKVAMVLNVVLVVIVAVVAIKFLVGLV